MGLNSRSIRWVTNRVSFRPLATWCGGNPFLFLGLLMIVVCCLVVKSYSHYGEIETPINLRDHISVTERLYESRTPDKSLYLPTCSPVPPNLKGRVKVLENVTIEEAEARVVGVKEGGFWWPSQCHPRWRVAIIVPYRDRASQMGSFLQHMHIFLQKQELNYSIYIVEQEGGDLFNRARLLNVGYLEAQKEGPWDCVAFHDIDMLPEDDRHLYHCSGQPRHLAVTASNHNYRAAYLKYFGGACLMTADQVTSVNGWSNVYWGWGGEDDDMWRRIAFEDMRVWRYPGHLARYKTMSHQPQVLNKERYKTLLRNTGRYPYDGLNSLHYDLRSIIRKQLYTHVLAFIGFSIDTTTISNGTTLTVS